MIISCYIVYSMIFQKQDTIYIQRYRTFKQLIDCFMFIIQGQSQILKFKNIIQKMKPQQNIIALDTSKRINGLKQVFRAGFSSNAGFHSKDKMFIYGAGRNVIIDTNDNQMQLVGHDNTVSCTCVSNSLLVASGQLASPGNKNYDSQVILWKIGTREPIGRLFGLKEGVKAIIFSNDSRYLAGVSFKDQLIIWDLKTQTEMYMKLFQNPLLVLNFNNNNIVLVVGKSIQNLSLTSLITQNKPPIYTNFTLPSTGLPRIYTCLSEIGIDNYLLGTESGQLCIFSKGVFRSATIVGKGKVHSIASSNGKQFFVSVGSQICRYDLFNQQLKQKERKKSAQVIKTVSVNEKGQIFAITQNGLYSISPDLKLQRLKISHGSRINSVSSRNNVIASIDDEGVIICRTFKNGSVGILNLWQSNPNPGRCISINANGNILAGFGDGKIVCLSPQANKVEWEIAAHKQAVTSIYSNDSYILSGGEDCVVRIWSKTRQLINQLSVHQKCVSKVLGDLAYPNIIYSCSLDRSIQSYDLKNDKKIYFKQAQGGNLTDMVQTKSGDLITCGFGSTVSLWKSADHQPYLSLQANDSHVLKLSINESGTMLILGHQNGLISVFNLKNNSLMGSFVGHSSLVSGVSWINDNTFVSVSQDFSTAIWNIQ